MAQKGANQYFPSILVVAMMIGAVMVINAEKTASVWTLTRDMRYAVAILVETPMIT